MFDKKLVIYETQDEKLITILYDDNDTIIDYDIYESPMYSLEQCIDKLFKYDNNLNSKLQNCIETLNEDLFITTLHAYNIYYEDYIIDDTLFNALKEYVEK